MNISLVLMLVKLDKILMNITKVRVYYKRAQKQKLQPCIEKTNHRIWENTKWELCILDFRK